MLKKLLADKKMLILVVAIVLVLVGTLIVVLTRDDSGKGVKPWLSIETDKDKGSESSKNDKDEESNDKVDDAEGELDDDILVDNKIWGKLADETEFLGEC